MTLSWSEGWPDEVLTEWSGAFSLPAPSEPKLLTSFKEVLVPRAPARRLDYVKLASSWGDRLAEHIDAAVGQSRSTVFSRAGRSFGVKLVPTIRLQEYEEVSISFLHEFRRMRRIRSEFIPRAYAIAFTERCCALLTDYFGEPLVSEDQSRLLVDVDILASARFGAEQLNVLHSAGLVHGDIDLLNMVALNDAARLVDFSGGQKTGGWLGNAAVANLPPEAGGSIRDQLRGEAERDIYALGLSLCDLIILKGEDVASHPIAGCIAACLNEDPAKRPSAGRLITMLDNERSPSPAPSADSNNQTITAALENRRLRNASGGVPPT